MNNHWNQFIYRLWSPVYDYIFNKGPFLRARKQVFSSVPFHCGDKVLFVGVGTGADLELIPTDKMKITAIDFSEEMLSKARKKFPSSQICFQQMDAENLLFPDGSFDYVIASLILSVVPDSEKAFAEMARVTDSNGQMIIFDKFVRKPSFIKMAIRPLIRYLGTDIGLSFERMFQKQASGLTVVEDRDVLFRGMYRKIKIRKN